MLILLVKSMRMRWITERLAAVGQMAFSNYISHSLIYALVFYAPGLRMMVISTRQVSLGVDLPSSMDISRTGGVRLS